MRYVFDTNVLVHQLRNSPTWQFIAATYQPFAEDVETFLSFASVAEILSMAEQANWGKPKQNKLFEAINEFEIVAVSGDMGDALVQAYVQIDSFSQGKNSRLALPTGTSARNMGKNDIWVAATAYALDAKLMTTDKDFLHLDPTLLEVVFVHIR